MGDDFSDPDHHHSVILHWNGTKWSQVATPAVGTGSELASVAAISRSNAWAVGEFDTGVGGHALVVHCC